jgi:hypothetical protein
VVMVMDLGRTIRGKGRASPEMAPLAILTRNCLEDISSIFDVSVKYAMVHHLYDTTSKIRALTLD